MLIHSQRLASSVASKKRSSAVLKLVCKAKAKSNKQDSGVDCLTDFRRSLPAAEPPARGRQAGRQAGGQREGEKKGKNSPQCERRSPKQQKKLELVVQLSLCSLLRSSSMLKERIRRATTTTRMFHLFGLKNIATSSRVAAETRKALRQVFLSLFLGGLHSQILAAHNTLLRLPSWRRDCLMSENISGTTDNNNNNNNSPPACLSGYGTSSMSLVAPVHFLRSLACLLTRYFYFDWLACVGPGDSAIAQ